MEESSCDRMDERFQDICRRRLDEESAVGAHAMWGRACCLDPPTVRPRISCVLAAAATTSTSARPVRPFNASHFSTRVGHRPLPIHRPSVKVLRPEHQRTRPIRIPSKRRYDQGQSGNLAQLGQVSPVSLFILSSARGRHPTIKCHATSQNNRGATRLTGCVPRIHNRDIQPREIPDVPRDQSQPVSFGGGGNKCVCRS